MEVTIYGQEGKEFGKFNFSEVLYIGTLIDQISEKVIPYKNEIDIQETLLHINKDFNMHSESILLIDDDEEFLQISKYYLQRLGHYVESFSDCEKAYYVLKNSPGRFSRLIIDQNMPDIQGDSFLKLIDKEIGEMKACILTASISSVPKFFNDRYSVIQKPCNMINIVGAASKKHIKIN